MSETKGDGVSRQQFLRGAAWGTAGLGLAALASCTKVDQPQARPAGGRLVVVTHGPDDPTRVMLALFTASRLPAGDNHVWFAIDGGQLCKQGAAEKVSSPLFEKQGNAAALLAELREKGTAIHI